MKYLYLLLPFLLFAACSGSSDNQQLYGSWQGHKWLIGEQAAERDATPVNFQFTPEGQYTAEFGAQSESGSYRLEGDKLYTDAEGQAQKMVQIRFTAPDTLRMDMNRAGTPEVLVLVKQ